MHHCQMLGRCRGFLGDCRIVPVSPASRIRWRLYTAASSSCLLFLSLPALSVLSASISVAVALCSSSPHVRTWIILRRKCNSQRVKVCNHVPHSGALRSRCTRKVNGGSQTRVRQVQTSRLQSCPVYCSSCLLCYCVLWQVSYNDNIMCNRN